MTALARRSPATLVVALVLVLPGAGAAAPAWLPPVDLGPQGAGAGTPHAAIAGDGTAFAVWTRSDGLNVRIQTAARVPGSVWQPGAFVSAAGRDASAPAVAADAAGNAVATWLRSNGTDLIVQSVFRPAGGAWQASQDLSAPGQSAGAPSVELDTAGNGLAVWTRSNGTNVVVQAAARPASSGVWSAPQTLSAAGEDAAEPALAVDGAGNAVAVWRRSDGLNTVVEAAVRPAGSAWQPAQALSAAGGDATRPEVAVVPDGSAVAVWERDELVGSVVQAAVRPAAAGWQLPQTLSALGQTSTEPAVALDGAGGAVAVWRRAGATGQVVQAAERPSGGSWGVPQTISTTGQEAGAPAVVVDAAGKAVASWLRTDMATDFAYGSSREAGAGWGAPVVLSGSGRNASALALAGDAAGNAVAVWRGAGTTDDVAQASAFDGAGPILRGLAIPATATAGTPLQLKADPVDVFALVAGEPSWTWGDGSAGASGPSATHNYRVPGTYTLAVHQADSFGNITLVSRRVAVARPTATVDRVQLQGAWRESRLTRPRLVMTGDLTGGTPAQVTLTATGPLRPLAYARSAKPGAIRLGRATLFADAPYHVLLAPPGARLLPGFYQLRIAGTAGGATLEPTVATLRVPAPREGVVMASKIGTTAAGPNRKRVRRATRLFARFRFAYAGRPKGIVRAVWYRPGGRRVLTVRKRPPEVVSSVRDARGLARGRWECRLTAGGRVVARVAIRIG